MEKVIELEVDRVATGGAGIARDTEGRIVFIDGGIPGDLVRASITRQRKQFANATVVEVLRPSADRVEAPCPHVADGCGGCDWQHVAPAAQSDLRRRIVVDSLRRGGKIDDVEVRVGGLLPPDGYRTTVRAAISGGRAGLRRAASHEVVVPGSCLVCHPLVDELLTDGRFIGAKEVRISVGARTGERMVLIEPLPGADLEISLPDDVRVARSDQLDSSRPVFIHEEVGGYRFRISAGSFFQCRPDGAEALVQAVHDVISVDDGPLLDAFCGVGLFGALIGRGRPLTAVENSRSSVLDARVNLPAATIVESPFEDWSPQPMATVIADPSRHGLDKRGVANVVATGATNVILVSCDPASLGRDAALLVASGYRLASVTVVDLFGHTSHVETVSAFTLP